jgi:hypothetical protein
MSLPLNTVGFARKEAGVPGLRDSQISPFLALPLPDTVSDPAYVITACLLLRGSWVGLRGQLFLLLPCGISWTVCYPLRCSGTLHAAV